MNAKKKDIEKLKEKLQIDVENLIIKIDSNFKFLEENQALDIYKYNANLIADLKAKKKKLEDYKKFIEDFENKQAQIQKDFLNEDILASDYLKDNKDIIEETRSYFRQLSKKFYPDKIAGITIENYTNKTNSAPNKLRFKIETKIESDSSQGIGNIKIFCYDLTILDLSKNSKIDFVFHDSRLFSDNAQDNRISIMFNILKNKYLNGWQKQYIASINENQLNKLTDEAKKFVKDNTILNLLDSSPNEKLLGLDIELDYD